MNELDDEKYTLKVGEKCLYRLLYVDDWKVMTPLYVDDTHVFYIGGDGKSFRALNATKFKKIIDPRIAIIAYALNLYSGSFLSAEEIALKIIDGIDSNGDKL